MQGILDYINDKYISGWILGELNLFKILIDGEYLINIKINFYHSKYVQDANPGKQATRFKIETPSTILDGKLHEIHIYMGIDHVAHSPAKFRFNNSKILFIHVPKTAGSTIIDSLKHFKSFQGIDHIQKFLRTPVDDIEKANPGASLNFLQRKKIESKFKKENSIDKNIKWIAGHISTLQAKKILNKYYSYSFTRNFKLSFTNIYSATTSNVNQEIQGFELYSLIRSPTAQLISGLNWFNEIFYGRDTDFFYSHNLNDIAKISFYLSKCDNSTLGLLAKILNLNMLNSQCKFIAPSLLIDPTYKTAVQSLKAYKFVGTTEKIDKLIKKITFEENEFPQFKTNITTTSQFIWDDLDSTLKNFIYKNMKSDLLLYESVNDYFG